MLGYLKKFNDLPADLKQKVSGKAAMATIEALEKKYHIPLAALVMKITVKEVSLADLVLYLAGENLGAEPARQLAAELKEKIFFGLGDYLSSGNLKSAEEEEGNFEVKAPVEAEVKNGEPAVKGASFFFSPEDEAEIRELAKRIGIVEKVELSAAATEEKLKEITSRAKINFGSADLAGRFSQILRTYFRGIRNRQEAKATLIKPFSSGGLNFDEDSAEQVLTLADRIVSSKPEETLKPLPKIKLPELEKATPALAPSGPSASPRPGQNEPARQAIARDAAYDFSKMPKRDDKNSAPGRPASVGDLKKFPPKAVQPWVEDTEHELAPLTPAVPEKPLIKAKPATPAIERKSEPAAAAKIKPQAGPAPEESARLPLIRRRFEAENLSQSQKVKVEDVKYVPRVMGPLDEIKYMDLINFRRLSKEPAQAAEKIRSKINLLEEESYAKKLEGIKAWRSSPINKFYLEIGHLSISGNKPINVIIEERKKAGQEYLMANEFEAIMDLNKSLRF